MSMLIMIMPVLAAQHIGYLKQIHRLTNQPVKSESGLIDFVPGGNTALPIDPDDFAYYSIHKGSVLKEWWTVQRYSNLHLLLLH
jgi:hypothetical protein